MASQFMHKQAYGLQTSSPKKWTAGDITRENVRAKSACRHVPFPMPPTIRLERLGPMTTKGLSSHLKAAIKACEKDTGHAVRTDAQLFLDVVMSYPVPTEKIMADKTWALWEKMDDWEQLILAHSEKRYADQLYGVLWHYDEEHPHAHAWVVAKRVGNKLTLHKAHPGLYSETQVKEPLLRKPAYKEAMSCDQFIYWLDVGRKMGWSIKSKFPRPRLSSALAKTRKKKDEEEAQKLALTLEKEQGLAAAREFQQQASKRLSM